MHYGVNDRHDDECQERGGDQPADHDRRKLGADDASIVTGGRGKWDERKAGRECRH